MLTSAKWQQRAPVKLTTEWRRRRTAGRSLKFFFRSSESRRILLSVDFRVGGCCRHDDVTPAAVSAHLIHCPGLLLSLFCGRPNSSRSLDRLRRHIRARLLDWATTACADRQSRALPACADCYVRHLRKPLNASPAAADNGVGTAWFNSESKWPISGHVLKSIASFSCPTCIRRPR